MTQEEFNQRYSYSEHDIISNCGELGSVYRAYDNVLHREVSIKIAMAGCKAFHDKRFYFKDEYEILKRIPKHQNIVFYDKYYWFERGGFMSSDFDGYDYVVMPYRFESNLSDLMQRELTMEQKESIAVQLLDGLNFLHQNKVIHGNFDPWSILIIKTRDGFAPLLTNFGLNKPLPYDFPETPSDPLFYNRAPWGGYDEKYGKNGDIEMYGIILYELFSGRPLYKDFEAIKRPVDYGDFALGGAAKWIWENVCGLLEKIPLPWRMMIEKCIIPENTYEFVKHDIVTTNDLYDIFESCNAPELILEEEDDISLGNMQSVVINGYTLQYQLGAGGMAEVWYAENKIGKKAAIKILLPNLCADKIIVARFENEAKVMVKLEHPNIRQVYDYTMVDGRPCIIMEYLEGNDLKALMKLEYQFSDDELVKWWNQMVQALNYTHNLGVIHRDVKPSNIFIDKYGNVKLLDFGIAKNDDNPANTSTGSTMGTLLYMSPEQVKDPKRVGYKTDVYSLAVTFVHLLTNKAPYDGTNSSNFEIQMNIVRKPLDISAVPSIWRVFLEPYLEKDPKNRPELMEFEEERFTNLRYDDKNDTIIETPQHHPSSNVQSEVKRIGDDLLVTINGVSFVMKYVEGGTFQMGATPEQGNDAREEEKPVHGVRLSSYYIGETPVTQALWKAVMGDNPSEFIGDDLPVDSIWRNHGLYEFVMKLNTMTGKNFRLPTEAEWEFAARGGNKSKGYKYAGSDDLDRVGWFCENTNFDRWEYKTYPVKQKKPNELGLYDMCGNVLEWCSDDYGKYNGGFQINPNPIFNDTGLHSSMARGGCFEFVEKACRVSSRFNTNQTIRSSWFGLRLALSVEK